MQIEHVWGAFEFLQTTQLRLEKSPIYPFAQLLDVDNLKSNLMFWIS